MRFRDHRTDHRTDRQGNRTKERSTLPCLLRRVRHSSFHQRVTLIMWIVCDAGFFNIVCQDDDEKKGLLTIKSRSRKDLERLEEYIPFIFAIEESDKTDYRFRRKARSDLVSNGIKQLVFDID